MLADSWLGLAILSPWVSKLRERRDWNTHDRWPERWNALRPVPRRAVNLWHAVVDRPGSAQSAGLPRPRPATLSGPSYTAWPPDVSTVPEPAAGRQQPWGWGQDSPRPWSAGGSERSRRWAAASRWPRASPMDCSSWPVLCRASSGTRLAGTLKERRAPQAAQGRPAEVRPTPPAHDPRRPNVAAETCGTRPPWTAPRSGPRCPSPAQAPKPGLGAGHTEPPRMCPGSRGGGVEGWETWRLYRAKATRPAPAIPSGACWIPELPRATAPGVLAVGWGLCLQPRSHLSWLSSRAFKEQSALPRPRAPLHVTSPAPAPPSRSPASPPEPGGSAAAQGTAAGGCEREVHLGARVWTPRSACLVYTELSLHSASGYAGGYPRLDSAGPFCPLSPLHSHPLSDRSCAGPLGESWDNSGVQSSSALFFPTPVPGWQRPGTRLPQVRKSLQPGKTDLRGSPPYLPPVLGVLLATTCWASPVRFQLGSGSAETRGEISARDAFYRGAETLQKCVMGFPVDILYLILF